MKISVVLTTYNRRTSLERCLESLFDQTFPADQYEIIVVSDGCSDSTVDLLRRLHPPCGFRWLEQPNQGQPAAQNNGLALAKGEYVVFMDDDCVCDSGLLTAHYEAHQLGGKRVVLGGKRVVLGATLLHPDTPSGTLRDNMQEFVDREFARLTSTGTRRSDLMLCANSSIAREAVLQFPLDPSYARIHDVAAGVKLWAAGYRPYFAPKAIAYECFIKSEEGLLRDAANQGKYEYVLCEQHPEFKPYTAVAAINEGSLLKRSLRKTLAVHPRLASLVLKPLYLAADALRTIPVFAQLARRTLRARAAIASLSGAIEQAGSWQKLNREFGPRVPVVMYHNVGDPRPGEYLGLTTPLSEFEWQIRLLMKWGYTGITPTEWLNWRNGIGSLPNRPVMIVFDDAYEEAANKAFPILERYDFPSACMVVTDHVGATNRWDEEVGHPSFNLMDTDAIRHWASKRVEFGGHTCGHPDLRHVANDRTESEIAGCKQSLSSLLGHRPVALAYPFGGVTPAARTSAAKHFDLAFTTWPGLLHLRTDLHLAPRVCFRPNETRLEIWCQLRFGKNPYEVLLNRCKALFTNKLN